MPGSIQSSRIRSGSASLHLPLRRFGVEGRDHLVAGAPEIDRDQRLDRGFVFNNKYRGGHGISKRKIEIEGIARSLLPPHDGICDSRPTDDGSAAGRCAMIGVPSVLRVHNPL